MIRIAPRGMEGVDVRLMAWRIDGGAAGPVLTLQVAASRSDALQLLGGLDRLTQEAAAFHRAPAEGVA